MINKLILMVILLLMGTGMGYFFLFQIPIIVILYIIFSLIDHPKKQKIAFYQKEHSYYRIKKQ